MVRPGFWPRLRPRIGRSMASARKKVILGQRYNNYMSIGMFQDISMYTGYTFSGIHLYSQSRSL